MNFIEEIRKTTKVNEKKLRTRGTKKIIKETKKRIQQAAKEGEYETKYYIPDDLLFCKRDIEKYFTKEGFLCFVDIGCIDYLVMVSWKEEEYNDNY